MEEQSPPDVTQLLLEWRNGDASALQRLMPLVYDELRRLARRCLRRERAGHTMQTTALVHEAYLRLIDANRVPWEDRAHFFAIAAQLMRRVLVDEARKRNFQKRGGAFTRISLDEAMMVSPERDAELLALDEALHRLGQFAPRKCRVVELRFFAGLSIEETATALSLSTDIVKREWRTAKLWLLHDESLWRGFLRKRYSTLEALNLAHGTSFASFNSVTIPASLLPASVPLSDWNDFVAEKSAAWRDFAQHALGFVPRSLGDTRTRWRDFLASRYSDIDELNDSYHAAYDGFESVSLPANEPVDGAPRGDWDEFQRATAGAAGASMRKRWQDFLARRYRRIGALNDAYDTSWRGFDDISIPDELPLREAALADWYQFESVVLPIEAAAHRFTVLLPAPKKRTQIEFQQRRDLATRIAAWEKPAHTVFDVKFYWAMFRAGAARLGYDTLIDVGSRAPELLSPMVLGQGYLAEGYIADARDLFGRQVLGREPLGQRKVPYPPSSEVGG